MRFYNPFQYLSLTKASHEQIRFQRPCHKEARFRATAPDFLPKRSKLSPLPGPNRTKH